MSDKTEQYFKNICVFKIVVGGGGGGAPRPRQLRPCNVGGLLCSKPQLPNMIEQVLSILTIQQKDAQTQTSTLYDAMMSRLNLE